jgi:hypothetical protein
MTFSTNKIFYKGECIMTIEQRDIKRTLEFVKTYIGTVLGIETLEYYDGNFLSGDLASRSRSKMELLELSVKEISDVIKGIV